ncbi:MAG: PilZ domain-containing protein [Polyangiaceae bacterium]|jgi:hypothetical protein
MHATPTAARPAVFAQSFRLLTPSLARAACGHVPPNRRREMRRRARLGCRVRNPDTWSLVGDRTVDLSPEGMLLLSDERIEEGSELVVSFQATELPIWFDTLACVTRIVEGRRPGDHGRALGLRFETLPAVSRLILRGHLRKLPLAPAQRDPPVAIRRQDPNYADVVRDIWQGN